MDCEEKLVPPIGKTTAEKSKPSLLDLTDSSQPQSEFFPNAQRNFVGNPIPRMLFAILEDLTEMQGYTCTSNVYFASLLNITNSQIRKYLKILEQENLIVIEKENHRPRKIWMKDFYERTH